MAHFDIAKFYLGVLCKNGHKWENTDNSLRNNNDRNCVQCKKDLGRKYKVEKCRKNRELRDKGIIPDKRKPTFEVVKEAFISRGYTLLSEEYKSQREPLSFICPSGHKSSIAWFSFQQGHGCQYCASRKLLTHEYIKDKFGEEGFELVDGEYKNSRSKLRVICPKGHELNITWGVFKDGGRCRKCSYENRKLDFEQIKAYFNEEGYILLSEEYKGSLEKLKAICPNGHELMVAWAHFKHSSTRCAKCSFANRTKTYEEVREAFLLRGFTLITKKQDYRGATFDKLDFICDKGHSHSISWASFYRGSGCGYCARRLPRTMEEVKQIFQDKGYKLVSDTYKTNNQKFDFICPNNHHWSMRLSHFMSGVECALCKGNARNNELTEKQRIDRRKIPGQIAWRVKVIIRDHQSCQVCSNSKDKIVAHHLYAYNAFPSLREEVINGITLCQRCHKSFHSAFRFGGNTKEQFDLFLVKNVEKGKIDVSVLNSFREKFVQLTLPQDNTTDTLHQ